MQTEIGKDILAAKDFLDKGEAVAIPTETVYGLAGNALNADAVVKIFKAKDRPQFNPLIIHLPLWRDTEKYIVDIPAAAQELAKYFSPGPITFLLPKNDLIPDLVTAGHTKVAVRIPAHPVALQLLKQLDYPLAAPSANPFGYVSPTTAQHVYEGLHGKIPYILDGGPCKVGLESTIVDFENGEVIIRRNGGISKEDIEDALGKKVLLQTSAQEHPVAPGQLKSHYATSTPLVVGDIAAEAAKNQGKKTIILQFGSEISVPGSISLNLSPSGNADEAAKNLFYLMREADALGGDLVIAPILPNNGLGRAVNDRLQKAQHIMKTDL
jgi:L-threonylcarbamoyladenylate synthase